MAEANTPYTFTNGVGNTIDATRVNANFSNHEDAINDIDKDQLTSDLADKLGVSSTATVRRGKCIIATEESRTNTAYGTLTTPDQVSSVVLPTDGLICVAYQAMWKESVTSAGAAAIFLGSNQLTVAYNNAATPQVQYAGLAGTQDVYHALASSTSGLIGTTGTGSTAYTGDVTTGQSVGFIDLTTTPVSVNAGACYIFAAAGTYTVSVRFKSTSGSVTAKNRKLWVWTLAF
jgi:hypothetical protein